ncbi:MAG: radical SAM protein [Clostridiales bacterium]|nr:radical SAM protein [Clostridiales bacterium]
MEYAQAQQLLTPVHADTEDFFYADWNMNLYRGCSHGCIYCDSRSLCYRLDRFDTIRPKANALPLLEDELRSRRKPGVITMGAMSDPYNPLEEQLCLTRGALELIRRHGFGAAFTTKSALCARDAGLLADIARRAPVCARLTITCGDDALCRQIEPNVSPFSERFAALRQLADAGVYAGVWLNPVLPFITDTEENILSVVRQAAAAGARFVVCFFGMTLRSGNREYYFDALEREFPGVRAGYLKVFGNAYECGSPHAQRLYEAFTAECARLGLAWRFRDVNAGMLRLQPRQMSLFDA